MSTLYMPIAPPGAGKSYTAAKMVRNGILDADAIVEPDRYREILSGDRACQTVNNAVFNIIDEIVLARLYNGLDVYLDATNLNKRARTKLLSRLPPKVHLHVLTYEGDKDTLYSQNVQRDHPVPEHVIDRMWNQWEDAIIHKPNNASLITFTPMTDYI